MPTVPSYQPIQTQTARTPDTRIRVNTDLETFGGGQSLENVNRAEQNLLGTIQKGINLTQDIFQAERKKADEIRVEEAINKATKQQLKYTYGSDDLNDDERGFISKKGKNAFEVLDTYDEKFGKDLSDIENELSNEYQKTMFKQKAEKMRMGMFEQMSKHVAVEHNLYERDTLKDSILTSQDEAVKNFGDPLVIAKALQRQAESAQKLAASQGLDEEQTKKFIAETQSSTHTSVIKRMLDGGNDRLAQSYYAQNKDAFTGKDSGNVEKALEDSSLRGESQRTADRIAATTSSLQVAISEVKKIEDPKLRDETMRRVKDEFDLKDAVKRQQTEQAYIGALNKIDQSGGNIDAVSREFFSSLSLQERNGLLSYAKNKREGIPVSTDWGEWYNLKTMASSEATREKFLTLNLMTKRHLLGDTEFTGLVNEQTRMRNGQDPDGMKEFRSNKQIADQTLEAVGINPNPKDGSKDAKDVLQFNIQFGQALTDFEKRTGKKPTNDDAQKIADELVTKGITKSGYFGMFQGEKFKFQIDPKDEMFKVEDIGGVPTMRRREIEAYLKKRNLPVTDEAVLETYNKVVDAQRKMTK